MGWLQFTHGALKTLLNVYAKFAKINESPKMFTSQQKESLVEFAKILNSSSTHKSLSATSDRDVIEFYFENRFPMFFLFGCVELCEVHMQDTWSFN